MLAELLAIPARLRIVAERLLVRLGFREETFLLLLAVLIGVVTAWAAVGFHQLIELLRNGLFGGLGPRLYEPALLPMLVLIPALGGLSVGLLNKWAAIRTGGQSMLDVIEAVMRCRGIIRPGTAIEKIITSGITIGSGGSAGAEGPIVQIGAGIASGIGQLFRVARPHMPILIGCGSAAGISAIFNAPIGGVFFTLEVVLGEFSIRTFTPLVLASVIANVTTKSIFSYFQSHQAYEAIFALPHWQISSQRELSWAHMGNFILLGLLCAAVAVALTRTMHWTEGFFARLRVPRWLKPAIGGAVLGTGGILYVVVVGWMLLDRPKPISFEHYPLPAFYSDGYGVISQLVRSGPGPTPEALHGVYAEHTTPHLLLLLGALCLLKLVGTTATLGSGGSGGIIAPSLFLGATAGGFLGIVLRWLGVDVQPHLYALVGMGAVLAAVVHAPLAAILILAELTQDYKLILPAMLATVVATGCAKLLYRDSIYTMSLRARGVVVGTSADLSLLRRLSVEQVRLAPATVVRLRDPFQKVLELSEQTGSSCFVVVDNDDRYVGMIGAEDLKVGLMEREAAPFLLAQDLVHPGVPLVAASDDLASVMDVFSRHDVEQLPVTISRDARRVIGLISRAALMRCYQQHLAES